MRQPYKMIILIIACAVQLFGNNMIAAQDGSQLKPPESAEQQSSLLDP